MLRAHVCVLCTLLTLSFAMFFITRAISLCAERTGAIVLAYGFAAAACNLNVLHMVLMLSYVFAPIALHFPMREWRTHAWYAAQWIGFDGLYRCDIAIQRCPPCTEACLCTGQVD